MTKYFYLLISYVLFFFSIFPTTSIAKLSVLSSPHGDVYAFTGMYTPQQNENCIFLYGVTKLTSIQYDKSATPELLEFLNQSDQSTIVIPVDFSSENGELPQYLKANLELFPQKNHYYFITYQNCGTSADGNNYEKHISDMYLLN